MTPSVKCANLSLYFSWYVVLEMSSEDERRSVVGTFTNRLQHHWYILSTRHPSGIVNPEGKSLSLRHPLNMLYMEVAEEVSIWGSVVREAHSLNIWFIVVADEVSIGGIETSEWQLPNMAFMVAAEDASKYGIEANE